MLATIPTKAAVDRAWRRYCDLHLAVQADPECRSDPQLNAGVMRAHERFCNLYNQWAGK